MHVNACNAPHARVSKVKIKMKYIQKYTTAQIKPRVYGRGVAFY